MIKENNTAPANYKGVMVSSTFTDLKEHRAALIKAIDGQDLKAVAMEHDSAKPDIDVLNSSLRMVGEASAYVGVLSHKYGQVPECPERNPDRLSLTELEFIEARRLERPMLIFIMGDDHAVKRGDVETDPEKIKKLEAFRENAKRMTPASSVHRVYKIFNSLHEFETAATQSIADLRRHLDKQVAPTAPEQRLLYRFTEDHWVDERLTIEHNFGYLPQISVMNLDGTEAGVLIAGRTEKTVTLGSSSKFSGEALLT